jgi:hypothetical protein
MLSAMRSLVCPYCQKRSLPVDGIYRATKAIPSTCTECGQKVYPDLLKRRLVAALLDVVIIISVVAFIVYPTLVALIGGLTIDASLLAMYLKYHPLVKASVEK